MKILILGIDGYIGWSLAQYLTHHGHEVGGVDVGFRRKWVKEMDSESVIPILSMDERQKAFKKHFGKKLHYWHGDLCNYNFTERVVKEFQPNAIVHLAQCPSAPYSMIDVQHATWVQQNNVVNAMNVMYAIKNTNPGIHLVKLGTMGEYGTPNMPIPEGFLEVEYKGHKDTLPFPRQAGSWYHQSKVHDSNNLMLANKIWGLSATDIMQGIVFGTSIEETSENQDLATRFDIDHAFGTIINRFCCQAVAEYPLTVYGKGLQKRSFIPLQDAVFCLKLAIENPASQGEYRVFNQFENVLSVAELVEKITLVGKSFGIQVSTDSIDNLRVENEENFYEPVNEKLKQLGYQAMGSIEFQLKEVVEKLLPWKGKIHSLRHVFLPKISWK